MTGLHELQRAMVQAIVTGDCDDAARAVVDDAPGALGRLHVYRNHYRITLIDALAATFPATLAAVGDDHFRAAARGYILTEPPSEPCLAAYGESFPSFLAQLPPLAAWPYLADLARLEWAINAAFHAADVAHSDDDARGVTAVSPGSEPHVHLHPSCRLVASAFAIDRIRRALIAGETVDTAPAPCNLLVFRLDGDVGWLSLPDAGAAFIAALARGGSLAATAAAAVALDPSFRPAALLAALIDHGLLVRQSVPPDHLQGGSTC
jgi:Uncharacterized protein conserved in bacteria (DUF2063).